MVRNQLSPNLIRQLLLLAVIILMGILLFREMHFMLNALLGAITLYVLLRSPMLYLVDQKKWKNWIAATVLIITSIVLLIIPVAWISKIAFTRLQPVIQDPSMISHSFESIHSYLVSQYNIDVLNADNVAKLNATFIKLTKDTLEGAIAGLGSLLIAYFILYFMLMRTMDVEIWLRKSLPLKYDNVQKVINEFRSMVYSNAIGIPLVALVQGLVGMIGYMIFGVKEAVLMGLLTAVASVMPVVGSMAIYVPLMIYAFSIGDSTQGIGVGLWGFILIGSVDNIARFLLQKKIANIHPLITIFGVLIGVKIFGFLGIIFGPILISMFILFVRVYIDEFGRFYTSDSHD